MQPNLTKRRIRENELALGFGVNLLRSSSAGILAAQAGYDWLFLDMEHNSMTVDDAAQICIAALGQGITPIVRVCKSSIAEGTRIMDNGAMGIVIPHVRTADEAREIVNTYLFPPLGNRSFVRLAHFGYVKPDYENMMSTVNDEMLIVVMIEDAEGVANADEIAAVDGIDALLFGTSDLSVNLGVTGQMRHPKIRDAYEKVADACKRHGKTLGMAGVFDPDAMRDYIGLGVRLVLVNTDAGYMSTAAAEQARNTRALL